MSSPSVTEIALVPLKPGSSLEPGTETAGALSHVTTTLRSQKGMQRICYGLELEAPVNMRLFVDWDRIEDHHAFMKVPEYGPMLEKIRAIVDGAPVIVHVPFKPFPPAALTAPVTEVFNPYFPSGFSDAEKQEAETALNKFVDVIRAHSPGNGFIAYSGGWVVEPMQHEGKEHTAFMAVLGWESTKAHMDFRETAPFKENIGLLRELKGRQGLDTYHISCSQG